MTISDFWNRCWCSHYKETHEQDEGDGAPRFCYACSCQGFQPRLLMPPTLYAGKEERRTFVIYARFDGSKARYVAVYNDGGIIFRKVIGARDFPWSDTEQRIKLTRKRYGKFHKALQEQGYEIVYKDQDMIRSIFARSRSQ